MGNLQFGRFEERGNDCLACWLQNWGRLPNRTGHISGDEIFRQLKRNERFFWVHWQVDFPTGVQTIDPDKAECVNRNETTFFGI